MKKITALFLSSLLVLGLTACGNAQGSNTDTDTDAKEATESSEATDADTNGSESTDADRTAENKILVVYYSASGNTERVAKDIADTLNADTFELIPQTPYTDEDLDWTEDGSRVNKEHDDEALRNIPLTQDSVENWDEYSTVFIGYAGGIIGLN